jgi:hypothetical protein
MTEAEVAEAYRDRFIRDRRAIEPLLEGERDDELPVDVVQRSTAAWNRESWRSGVRKLGKPSRPAGSLSWCFPTHLDEVCSTL